MAEGDGVIAIRYALASGLLRDNEILSLPEGYAIALPLLQRRLTLLLQRYRATIGDITPLSAAITPLLRRLLALAAYYVTPAFSYKAAAKR